jgi:hypothetical protein
MGFKGSPLTSFAAWTGKGFRGGHQRLQIKVCFCDSVSKIGQRGGIPGYPFMALDDHGCPIF